MLNKLRKLQNRKGFTLVELIVVIAIIAILTAVIVPLVGRYSAQATYSTLQDSAKTISNDVSTVLADATKMGTVLKISGVTGEKSSSKGLSITLYDSTGAAISSPDADESKLETALKESLESALDDGAGFVAKVVKNTCDAVLYSKTSSDLSGITPSSTPSISKDTEFDEAYLMNSKAIGVAGSWKVGS